MEITISSVPEQGKCKLLSLPCKVAGKDEYGDTWVHLAGGFICIDSCGDPYIYSYHYIENVMSKIFGDRELTLLPEGTTITISL